MADILDLLTIEEAKNAISMSAFNEDHTTVLGRHVTAVSRLIDRHCGPVVVRTIAAELHAGGRQTIWVRRWPVTSFTLVREDQGGTIVEVNPVVFGETSDGYFADQYDNDPTLLLGTIHRRSGSWSTGWCSGTGGVEITYEAGRYPTTAEVDARFKDAAGAILRRLWKREAGTWSQSATFFEGDDSQVGSGFFRVAEPILAEMLWDERQFGGAR